MTPRHTGVLIGVLLAGVGTSLAQERTSGPRAAAFDTVVGVQDFFADGGTSQPQVLVDIMTSVEVAPRTQITARPVLWRMRGEWLTLMDQLSLRHEFSAGSNWRVEAGRFPSPMGLGMMENRASTNAGVMWCHRPLYMPLPSPGAGLPSLSLVSAVYPLGVQVSTAADRWDARAAIVDTAPVQFWRPKPSTVSRSLNGIAGAGVTAVPGLRLGGGAAWGTVAQAPAGRDALPYVMLNVEGEYAFNYTKISGEWTRDRFDTPAGDRSAGGWTVQVRQTVTPRLFVHSRVSAIRAPATGSPASPSLDHKRYRAADSTIGYLLTPDLTVRVGHSLVKPFSAATYDHQIGLSLIWARRWW